MAPVESSPASSVLPDSFAVSRRTPGSQDKRARHRGAWREGTGPRVGSLHTTGLTASQPSQEHQRPRVGLGLRAGLPTRMPRSPAPAPAYQPASSDPASDSRRQGQRQIKERRGHLVLHHGFLHALHVEDHRNEVLHRLGELGLGAGVHRQLLYRLFVLEGRGPVRDPRRQAKRSGGGVRAADRGGGIRAPRAWKPRRGEGRGGSTGIGCPPRAPKSLRPL